MVTLSIILGYILCGCVVGAYAAYRGDETIDVAGVVVLWPAFIIAGMVWIIFHIFIGIAILLKVAFGR